MKQDDTKPTDEAIEARIVAWVLGEASPFEAEELARLCAADPALGAFRQRMFSLHSLLADAAKAEDDSDWKLSAARKESLEAIFEEVPEKPVVRLRRWRITPVVTGIAATLAAGFVTVRYYQNSNNSERGGYGALGTSGTEVSTHRIVALMEKDVPIPSAVQDDWQNIKTQTIVANGMASMNSGGGIDPKSVIDDRLLPEAENQSRVASLPPVDRMRSAAGLGGAGIGSGMGGGMKDGAAEAKRKSSLRDVGEPVPSGGYAYLSQDEGLKVRTEGDKDLAYNDAKPKPRSLPAPAAPAAPTEPSVVADDVIAKKAEAASPEQQEIAAAERAFGGDRKFSMRMRMGSEMSDSSMLADSPPPPAPPPGYDFQSSLESAVRPPADGPRSEFTVPDGSSAAASPAADPFAASAPIPMEPAKPATAGVPDPFAGQEREESRPAPFDLGEIAAIQEPFSTFSLSVSDVSFQLAKAAVDQGQRPAPDQIKIEQFYNAVDYGDPAPSSGEPVAGVVEQSAHPVIPGRNLVRLSVRTASSGRSAQQPLHLTLLIDQSGSMVREDRKAAMEKAMADLSTLLTPNDRVSVIGFSRTATLLGDAVPGDQLRNVTGVMNPEANEGGTNLEEAVAVASEVAARRKTPEAQNRIVLFTDGAANLGNADPARLAERVKALRQNGIAFDVAGIGADDLNDRLLAELARNGDGRYYLATDDFAKRLAGAFRPAAEDAKVQVRFNPERVARYKLIGFEKNRLKTEDFRNDAVDAGELAAEESATALYQVELLPQGNGEIGEMSVRFRDAGTRETVERSWTIRYDETAPAFDRSSFPMRLAGLSMLAAEKLMGGPAADRINLKDLAAVSAEVKNYYKDSGKAADMLRLLEAIGR